MNSKWIKYIVLLLILVSTGIVFYKKVYIPKATYDFINPKKGDFSINVFGIGEVTAKEIYPITSQTGGRIISLLTDQGKWVKKGELIAKIDPVDLPDILKQAEISLKKSKYEIDALQKELESLIARKRLSQINYERYYKLRKQGFSAKIEYDKAKSDLESIKASIEASKAKILSAKEERKRAEKNIEALKEKLSRFEIFSPIDGYVVSKDAQVFQTINPSSPVVTVVDPKSVWVKTYIDETLSGNIKTGNKAYITLRSSPDKKLRGFVSRIEAKSDPVTQERMVDVSFENIPTPFYLNEQAEVLISTKTLQNIIKIPLKVLVMKKGKEGVWIYEKGKAHFKEVDILARSGDYAAVKGIGTVDRILVPSPKKKPLFEGVSIRL